ncbi:MAG: GxxExxY protein [Pirellulaceae bacterium]|nr:GxxExxY protein [Pirellulaceae bacterium]
MPIYCPIETIRPTQAEFGEIAFDVMNHVFAIHNEFGRFFDEAVYKRELSYRMPGIELELPVTVSHDSFFKTYKLDILASRRGLFEFKAVESIVPRHQSQTINYLFLFNLPHGKIINVRPERVTSKFVNCRNRLALLKNPVTYKTGFQFDSPGGNFFYDRIMSLLLDWGPCSASTSTHDFESHSMGQHHSRARHI